MQCSQRCLASAFLPSGKVGYPLPFSSFKLLIFWFRFPFSLPTESIPESSSSSSRSASTTTTITLHGDQSPVIIRSRSGSITIPLSSASQGPSLERSAVTPFSQLSPLSTSFPNRSPPLFPQTHPLQGPGSADGSSSLSLLDPATALLHEHYRRSYADILYRWGELSKHAEVLRFVEDSSAVQQSKALRT